MNISTLRREHGHPVLCKDCARKQEGMIKAGTMKRINRLPTATIKELGE